MKLLSSKLTNNIELRMAKAPTITSGFTIIELMITLAVAAILAAVAAPSFTDMIRDNRLVTQLNEFQASLALARSEAIKRNQNVTVCRSNNGSACSGNWENGWIIFGDDNANGTVNTGEEIYRIHGAISGANTLRFNQTRVIYAGDGIVRGGSNGTFTFCDARGANSARGIVISTTGRPRLATDGNSDGIVEDGSGNNVTCP